MAPVLGLERRMDDLESKLEMVRGGQRGLIKKKYA